MLFLDGVFEKIKKSDFVRNSLTLTIGTFTAQFFPLIIYPILGRIYTPEQFGFLAAITSVTSILSVYSTGKYEQSILLAEDDEKAVNVVGLSLLLSFIVLLISTIPFIIFKESLGKIFKTDFSIGWILVCVCSAFFINVFNCYNEWCVRKKQYKKLSLNKITNSASVSGCKLLFGFIKISSQGLVLGDFLGRLITAAACLVRMIMPDIKTFRRVTANGMYLQAKRYKDFPKYTMPAQLLNTLGASVPVLLIGYFFDGKTLGYYSMASSVLVLPINVVSLAVRDVFRQKANEEYRGKGEFKSLFVRIFKIAFWVAVVVAVPVFFFLPDIFQIVLGKDWIEAGIYSQIMLPMIVFDFVAMSLSGVLTITEKLKQQLWWQIYYVSVSILSVLAGCLFYDNIHTVLILFTIARLSAYLYLLLISYHYSKNSNDKI